MRGLSRVLGLTGVLVIGLVSAAARGAAEEEAKVTTTSSAPAVAPAVTPALTPATAGAGGYAPVAVPPGVPGGPPGPAGPEPSKDKPDGKEDKGKDKEKDKEGDKGPEGKKDQKEDEAPKTVTRPTEPQQPPDPNELKVRPGDDHRVQFQFKGQPWPAVLEWLADISGMSLDWQEAPGGFVNLTTQRRYTVEETRDLLNRLLLDRGFVLLSHGEVLSLVNLKKLDPSVVPRVTAQQLDGRSPHEYVKVSFPLGRLVAEEAVEELKPVLSPHGRLTAMQATNCLEAMDAVVNLRQLAAMLAREETSGADRAPPRVFTLRYRRASEVVSQLETLLGTGSKKPSGPMTPDQMRKMAEQQAMMQQQMQQQQQQQQGGPQPGKPGPKAEAEIHLVADDRNRTILADAPPDKMSIIEQAIQAIDIPDPRAESLPATLERMHIYHLSAMDPEPLVKTLQEIGGLDVSTRLEVDRENKAIIAYATLADHVTIRSLIEKLDLGGRRFEVISLRRLEADYVAGTIQHMIFGGRDAEEPKKNDRRSRWYYDDYYGGSQQAVGKPDRFRVDADVEHNRLLLWANDVELADVQKLLVKLGEIPPAGGRTERIRVLDVYDEAELRQLVDRVRQAWPRGNPLQLDPSVTEPKPSPEKPAESLLPVAPPVRKTAGLPVQVPAALALAQLPPEASSPPAGENCVTPPASHGEATPPVPASETRAPAAAEPARPPSAAGSVPPSPVRITRNAAGRLVLSSEDTAALDLVEELIGQLAPPRKDYQLIRLKHAWAYDVAFNLESFFKEEEKEKDRRYRYWDYWDEPLPESTKEPARLSKRRPLKFIADSDSNSILVQGADPAQMKQIEELVAFYDKPQATDSQNVRQTGTFALRYSKARVVAEAIKEVYRDLLSSNDKAFAGGKKGKDRPENPFAVIYNSSGDGQEESAEKAPRFKGLLSIGVDELSNTLIISAPECMFSKVSDLVRTLDEAAKPVTTVRVVKVGNNVSAARLQQVLSGVTGQSASSPPGSPGTKGPATQPTPPPQPQPHPTPADASEE